MGIRRALTAAGLVGVLATSAACNASADVEAGADPAATSSTTPRATPGAAQPSITSVTDPSHAMDPPGPRTGRLYSADLLVNSKESLPPEQIKQIKQIKGVSAMETFGLAQIAVEGEVLNLAAVDPASYRLFTPRAGADYQEVWDRVAGGEVALLPELKKQVTLDRSGSIRLGSSASAPVAHVGAYAPQIPKAVDAVVNDTWIDALGMQPDNALLISTTTTSPRVVRKQIRKIVGAENPVQILATDLKIGSTLTALVVGSIADAVGVFNYTLLGGGRVAPEPSWVRAHIATETVPILGSVTCNRAIFPQLKAALGEIVATPGLAAKIHPGEYAGCYYPRFIAGTSKLSNHAFGLALDLNTPGNQRGTVGEMDRTVVSIFKKWGFSWGGDWRYTDPMHFEMNRIVQPR